MNSLLEKLKLSVDQLHGLLDAPEPGLFTWNLMVGKKWKEIADLWGDDPAAETGGAGEK